MAERSYGWATKEDRQAASRIFAGQLADCSPYALEVTYDFESTSAATALFKSNDLKLALGQIYPGTQDDSFARVHVQIDTKGRLAVGLRFYFGSQSPEDHPDLPPRNIRKIAHDLGAKLDYSDVVHGYREATLISMVERHFPLDDLDQLPQVALPLFKTYFAYVKILVK